MTALKPITIIGGGIAGLTLGIGLRRRDIPTVLWEAGNYPRHRVCGEFISGAGQKVLRRVGLIERILAAGARPARTVAFSTVQRNSRAIPLPQPALCLSRFALDELLARYFCELGGELRTNRRWFGREEEGVVHASGRRARPIVKGWRWFGLKAHASDVTLRADLEMHLSHNGYVGLCKLEGGIVNVCGLFRSRSTMPDIAHRWRELLSGEAGSRRHKRLGGATFDEESFCAVSGLSMEPQCATDSDQCRIGDAVTMTPPLTGNGMSMAFESADLAIVPLEAYSRNEVSWLETQGRIARACDNAFARRLAWANPLQELLLQPQCGAIVLIAGLWPWFFRLLFMRTR